MGTVFYSVLWNYVPCLWIGLFCGWDYTCMYKRVRESCQYKTSQLTWCDRGCLCIKAERIQNEEITLWRGYSQKILSLRTKFPQSLISWQSHFSGQLVMTVPTFSIMIVPIPDALLSLPLLLLSAGGLPHCLFYRVNRIHQTEFLSFPTINM